MKSRLEQKLLHKALSFKFDDNAMLLDAIIEDQANKEVVNAKFKNVCAMISKPLTERLENTLGILRISKREFLELAIIEALDKADLIMDEVDIMEDHRAIEAHEAHQASQVKDAA